METISYRKRGRGWQFKYGSAYLEARGKENVMLLCSMTEFPRKRLRKKLQIEKKIVVYLYSFFKNQVKLKLKFGILNFSKILRLNCS